MCCSALIQPEFIMLQTMPAASLNKEVTAYFARAVMPSQQETLGAIVVEVLGSGRTLSRKAICLRLIARLEKAASPEEEQHLQELVSLLFSQHTTCTRTDNDETVQV